MNSVSELTTALKKKKRGRTTGKTQNPRIKILNILQLDRRNKF